MLPTDLAALSDALSRLTPELAGYPIDPAENVVRPPEAPERVARTLATLGDVPQALRHFYSHCDGIDMMDVHYGAMAYSASDLARADEEGHARNIVGGPNEPILTIGQNGGGDRYAIGRQSGQVFFIPHEIVTGPDVVWAEGCRVAATSLEAWVAALRRAAETFLEDPHRCQLP